MGKGAHAAAEDAGEMDAAAWKFIDHEGRSGDVDECALSDLVEESDHVLVAHDHTPVGQGSADKVLPAGAVDIDVALVGINSRALVDPLLKAFEPQNAGQDKVISCLAMVPVFARVLAVPEDAARGRACAELLHDPVKTERRFERVLTTANAEAGGGGCEVFDDNVL